MIAAVIDRRYRFRRLEAREPHKRDACAPKIELIGLNVVIYRKLVGVRS